MELELGLKAKKVELVADMKVAPHTEEESINASTEDMNAFSSALASVADHKIEDNSMLQLSTRGMGLSSLLSDLGEGDDSLASVEIDAGDGDADKTLTEVSETSAAEVSEQVAQTPDETAAVDVTETTKTQT